MTKTAQLTIAEIANTGTFFAASAGIANAAIASRRHARISSID